MRRRPQLEHAYWFLASERQRIFERRLAGCQPPWTSDPVLATFKFTNPWRASDRVTQFLIREVIYRYPNLSEEDLIARIVLFRLFSKPATWTAIEREIGPVTAQTIRGTRIAEVLEQLQARGPIYTSAFILCANRAYGYERKYRNHLALVQDMLTQRLPAALGRARSLQEVYGLLVSYPLVGPFMGYQLAIDINYSELVDFSEDEFTVPGPGAERGIRKVYPGVGRREMPRIIHAMVDGQEDMSEAFGLTVPKLLGRRRLHAIDCQNLFCELDKYARVAFPEITSSRSRIKARFRPSAEPMPLFYPPKWGLEDAPHRGEVGLNLA